MFSRPNKSKDGRERNVTPSIIGTDCTLTGNILSQGEVHVDGRVEGDIRCDTLVVGQSGTITGEISAETVRVLGTVTGQIRSRAVQLAKTAHVVGDIVHETLSIEAGAFVEGRFDRMSPTGLGDSKALPDRNAAGQALLSAPDGKETDKDKDKEPDAAIAAPAPAAG